MKEKVLNILKEVNSNIVDGIDLISSGVIDSFEVVNIVMELELPNNYFIEAKESNLFKNSIFSISLLFSKSFLSKSRGVC